MSRIGKLPITLPDGVTVKIDDSTVTVKGKLGELSQTLTEGVTAEMEDGTVVVKRPSESKKHRSLHGLYRSLINNMVHGVTTGYEINMELVGVGYRAENKGQILELNLGFSHPIYIALPQEITVEAVTDRRSNPTIKLKSFDKQLVGQVAAKIRSFRSPEPYKGKGIKFAGEQIRRKAGKSAGK